MDLITALFSNLWTIFLIVLFFGGSIFVHELGHFLAARRRGVHVDRFSIGFGPKIFSWKGKDGVEYRLSWLPLGGYVSLPQLADMRGIEGETEADLKRLAPISYSTKIIVFGAGATFNLIFAFLLACIIWVAGQPTSSDQATTRIGYIVPTLALADGTEVPSPASVAGLRLGDTVRAIDGRPIADWQELMQTLVTSAGRTADGRRTSTFSIERDGQLQDVVIHPLLSGDEQVRRVGIAPAYELVVYSVEEGSVAAQIGLQPQDRLLTLDGTPVLNVQTYVEYLTAHRARAIFIGVRRPRRRPHAVCHHWSSPRAGAAGQLHRHDPERVHGAVIFDDSLRQLFRYPPDRAGCDAAPTEGRNGTRDGQVTKPRDGVAAVEAHHAPPGSCHASRPRSHFLTDVLQPLPFSDPAAPDPRGEGRIGRSRGRQSPPRPVDDDERHAGCRGHGKAIRRPRGGRL
jgi:RIP metalloprotease RseP